MTELFDPAIISVLVTFVLGLLASVGKIVQIKTKFSAVQKVINEIGKAMEDDKITVAEARSIITLFRAVLK